MTLKDLLIFSTTIQVLYIDGEAGVKLWFESQERGQGTPRANMRGVQYVKNLCVGAPLPTLLLSSFHSSPVLCIDSWADVFVFKRRERFSLRFSQNVRGTC